MKAKKIWLWASIFMGVNVLAFCVNSLDISPRFTTSKGDNKYEVYLLTDSSEATADTIENRALAKIDLWPFVCYYCKSSNSQDNYVATFRGVFADFGLTEFVFYTFIIVMISAFLFLW